MQLGMVGLGKMGSFMTQRLLAGGHQVVAFDLSRDAVDAAVKQGARGVVSLQELVGALDHPRAVWIMVPSGDATGKTLESVAAHLAAGDVMIDGGNSGFVDLGNFWSRARQPHRRSGRIEVGDPETRFSVTLSEAANGLLLSKGLSQLS